MGFTDWWGLVHTYLRPHRREAATAGFVLFVSIALQLVTPQLVRVFIDRATSPRGAGSIGMLAGLYLTAVLLQQVFRVVAVWLGELLGWLTTNELRADLMAHCLGLDPQFHMIHNPGELIERIDGDLDGLSLFFSQFLLNVIGSLPRTGTCATDEIWRSDRERHDSGVDGAAREELVRHRPR